MRVDYYQGRLLRGWITARVDYYEGGLPSGWITARVDYCEGGLPSVGGWLRGTVVERRSLTGELSLSCARPAADG